MIAVHKLNGKEFVINCEQIKYIEATPDTLITLMDNDKIMIKDSVQSVIEAAIQYKKEIYSFAKPQ